MAQRSTGANTPQLPWVVAGVALVALVALLAGQRFQSHTAQNVDGSANALPQAGLDDRRGSDAEPPAGMRAPDISSMSPKERAERLYDRVMRYAEAGRTDSLQFFAPMAIQAYQMLGTLDADDRYDMGRIAEVAGALPLAAAQADSILAVNQTHLLGLALAMRVAGQEGKREQARDFGARLIANVDAERRKSLPEYQRHASDIDAAVNEAKQQWAKR